MIKLFSIEKCTCTPYDSIVHGEFGSTVEIDRNNNDRMNSMPKDNNES